MCVEIDYYYYFKLQFVGAVMKSDTKGESTEYENIETMSLPMMFVELLNHYGDKKYDKERKELLREKLSLASEKDADGICLCSLFME